MNKNLIPILKQYLINKLVLLKGQEIVSSELPYILTERENQVGWCQTNQEAFNGLKNNLEEYSMFVSWFRNTYDEIIYFEEQPIEERHSVKTVYTTFMIVLAEELTKTVLYRTNYEENEYREYTVIDSDFIDNFKRKLESINCIGNII